MSLSYQEQLALAITPKCTASLSIPCSIFIIYEVWCDHRKGRSGPIQRALVGMSAVDILASFGWWLSTWAVPEGSFALSAGNQGSCNFQGFLLQLAIGAPLYNCSLALYYLMVIKYNWSNEMLRRIEVWTHGAIFSFAIGTSIALLPLEQYNHIGSVCWVIGSPPQCGNSSYQPSDIPCERGDFAYLYGLALFYGPLWGCIVACIVSMSVIYYEVKKTHRRIQRYSANGRQIHSLRRSATDTSLVATQAILYSLSFFVTWLPSTIWSIAHWFNIENFWLDFFSAFCEPLQGWWNLLIFLRRRPGSQEKIRVAFNTIFPCLCKVPRRLHDSTASSSTRRGSRSNRSSFSTRNDRCPSSTKQSRASFAECEENPYGYGYGSGGSSEAFAPTVQLEQSEGSRESVAASHAMENGECCRGPASGSETQPQDANRELSSAMDGPLSHDRDTTLTDSVSLTDAEAQPRNTSASQSAENPSIAISSEPDPENPQLENESSEQAPSG